MRDKLGRFVKGYRSNPTYEFQKGNPKPKNAHSWKKGCKSPCWKGGKYKHSSGYIFIFKPNHPFANPNGYVFEHRLIMEKMLGRYLLPEERVHHNNNVREDNRPENLKLFANDSKHMKFHTDIITNFKKGHIPWNKGLKTQSNTGKTHFSKGHIPWNKKV